MNKSAPVNADHDPRNADWMRHTRPTMEELAKRHERRATDATEMRDRIRDSCASVKGVLADGEGRLTQKAVDQLNNAIAALAIAEHEVDVRVEFYTQAWQTALKETQR